MEEKSQVAVCYVGSSSTNKGLELCLMINFCPFWKTSLSSSTAGQMAVTLEDH